MQSIIFKSVQKPLIYLVYGLITINVMSWIISSLIAIVKDSIKYHVCFGLVEIANGTGTIAKILIWIMTNVKT